MTLQEKLSFEILHELQEMHYTSLLLASIKSADWRITDRMNRMSESNKTTNMQIRKMLEEREEDNE